jgi:sec-independent protein translocase protein TatC
VIGYQLWRFVAPGLYRSEKQAFLPFLIASPVMFFIGAAFAYYVILPMAYDFFLGFQQGPMALPDDPAEVRGGRPAKARWRGSCSRARSGISGALTTKFMLAFGLSFQLPVALTLMGKAGLVSSEGLASVRKYAIVVILVMAAIVTPPDVVSQAVLFAVIYGLYEVSIQLVAASSAARRRAAREGCRKPMNDATLTRIAEALERLAPAPAPAPSFAEADAYIWQTDPDRLEPVAVSTGSIWCS